MYANATILLAAVVFGSTLQAQAQVFHWDRAGVPVAREQGLQRNPLCATDEAGGAIVGWEDVGPAASRIVLQRIDVDGRRMWDSAGIAIASGTASKALGRLVSDGSGGAFVCWWEKRNTLDYDVFAQHVSSTGALLWTSTGVPVSAAGGDQLLCGLALDGQGGVVLAWEDHRLSGNTDIFLQRLTAAGAALWEQDGRNITATAGDQLSPVITGDNAGGAIVVWSDKRKDEDVYAQRIDFLGNAAWGAGGMAVTTLPSRQTRPQLVQSRQTQTLVFWEDFRDGASSDIWYQKLAADGRPQFPVNGVPLTKGKNNQTNLDVAPDGLGGAIASWSDFRGGATPDIYARRVDANGYATWKISGADSANGIAVSNPADIQESPCVLSDGNGGALLAWQDRRNGMDLDLYMQALYPNATIRYPANGAPLMREARNQVGMRCVPSAPGSAIFVWSDGRIADGSADIYAQRVGLTALQPDSVIFDSTTYGNERLRSVVLRNLGADTLVVTTLNLTGGQSSDYVVADMPALPFLILPRDSASIGVKFIPRDKGYRFTSMRVMYNVAGSQQYIQLAGYGLLPNLATFPGRADYGLRKVGAPADSTFRGILKNNGFGPLVIHTVRFDGANADAFSFTDLPPLPLTIRANDSIPLTVRYTPRSSVNEFAYLTVMGNGGTPVRAVYVNGTGVYPASTFAPATLRFDSSSGNTVTRSVTVKLTGTVPMQILAAGIEGTNRADFSVTLATPRTLAKGDSVIIPVRFAALYNGPRNAYLRLVTDMFAPLILVPLNGIGVRIATAADDAPAPRSLRIGQPYPNPVSLSAHGSVTLPIEGMSDAGAFAGIPVTFFNALGERVATARANATTTNSILSFSIRDLVPGVYHISIGGVASARVVIVR
ncbi:MAG: choice-of-anchor D domain-containing protein [Ignavibacteria bacterium]|nr:choice-of-anchor D domain-containing protein [Ignavibacteria bacterium]